MTCALFGIGRREKGYEEKNEKTVGFAGKHGPNGMDSFTYFFTRQIKITQNINCNFCVK